MTKCQSLDYIKTTNINIQMGKNNIDKILLKDDFDDNSDFVAVSMDDKDLFDKNINIPDILPILPLRNTVLFPGVILPIGVGRSKSFKIIKDAYKEGKTIGVITQKRYDIENPTQEDLFTIGTVATILRIIEMPNGGTTAIIQGNKRFQLEDILYDEPYHVGKIHVIEDESLTDKNNKEIIAINNSLKEMAEQIMKYSAQFAKETQIALKNIESILFLVNFISCNMDIDYKVKQDLLEINNVKQRGLKLLEILNNQVNILKIKSDIQKKVKSDIDKQQKEYLLHQQIKTIQNELGDNPADSEIQEIKEKASSKKWNDNIKKIFDKEFKKLQRINQAAPDYSIQTNYLNEMLDLPWNHYSKDNLDLKHAEEVLNKDHYGLEKVKERILEYIAVLKLKANMKSPIICLYGPPGVGKTSLGKSIAEALNRKYIRMSMGGLHDEAEIRGHRKTYIGAMTGRILQNIKKAGTSNPVFVLDEIDKVSNDYRGDPQSALLEVLDPEQNSTFHDNFLDMDYDLSKVMFVATANDLSTIAPALRDRMEIIEINGYLIDEKVQIAKRHLITKELENNGIKSKNITIPDDTIEYIIEKYTRESGVRSLEMMIAKLMRRIAKDVAQDSNYSVLVTKDKVKELLGSPIFLREEYEGNDYIGVVTGLAWTAVGGEILFIESSLSKGKGILTMTGNLGDVMKESATIAFQYIKSHAAELGIDEDLIENRNIHIHVPAGAVPKDGPSAGITIISSMVSSFTGKKIKKALAMTGEIALRGTVMPVGGIREKILAAKRAGIKEIILSDTNRKDIEEIKKDYIEGLIFHYVKTINEVISLALEN